MRWSEPPASPAESFSTSSTGSPGTRGNHGVSGGASPPMIIETSIDGSSASPLIVPSTRPPRSTVTRSATAITSGSLCVMKRIALPSFRSWRSTPKRLSTSLGASTAVGSSRIRTRASR
ncbi:MAG: hypothetical protein U0527_16555 [Candidatus Eisenbacteria bacterium]